MNDCIQQALSTSPHRDPPSQSAWLVCVPSSQQIPLPRGTGPLPSLLPSPVPRPPQKSPRAIRHVLSHLPFRTLSSPDQDALPAQPLSGPRQPSGPTLSPLLRTCQGHVSTLPNSEFLITPNMVSPRGSGHTTARGVAAAAAGATGGDRGSPGEPALVARKGGGRGTSDSAPRNCAPRGGPGVGRPGPGKRREERRPASAGQPGVLGKELSFGSRESRSPPLLLF